MLYKEKTQLAHRGASLNSADVFGIFPVAKFRVSMSSAVPTTLRLHVSISDNIWPSLNFKNAYMPPKRGPVLKQRRQKKN